MAVNAGGDTGHGGFGGNVRWPATPRAKPRRPSTDPRRLPLPPLLLLTLPLLLSLLSLGGRGLARTQVGKYGSYVLC